MNRNSDQNNPFKYLTERILFHQLRCGWKGVAQSHIWIAIIVAVIFRFPFFLLFLLD